MNNNKIFKFFGIILLLIFIFLVIASKSGYYEYELSQKTKLTDEAIERFEDDVKNGKSIDINNYMNTKAKNYNNKISNVGNEISNSVEKIISKGFSYLFNYLNKQISD